MYADDTIVVIETENTLQCFLDEMGIVLPCTGLRINYNKSTILIRDPLQIEEDYEEVEVYFIERQTHIKNNEERFYKIY